MLCVLLGANSLATAIPAQCVEEYLNLSLKELADLRVTVTASGYQEKAIDAPASVTTFYDKEWQLLGDRTLFDVISNTPGVHTSISQLVFGSNTAIFRGLRNDDNAGLKLLIDGEPVEFLYSSGFFYTFNKPLTGIERIEVVRGPGSALYGSDAFAGAINLITKDTLSSDPQFVLRASRDDSLDLGFFTGYALDNFKVSFSIDYITSNDDPNRIIQSDLQTNLDALSNTSASLAPGTIDNRYEILDSHLKLAGDNWRINGWTWHNLDGGAGPGVSQALDPNADIRIDADMLTAAYKWDSLPIRGDMELAGGYQRHFQSMTLALFPPGALLPLSADGNLALGPPFSSFAEFPDGVIGKPKMNTERSFANLTYLAQIKKHKVRLQVGTEDQSMETSESKNFGKGVLDGTETQVDGELTNISNTEYVYAPDSSRSFNFLALQDDWQFHKQWRLNLGVRYDDYSDFGDTTNPRASLIWKASANTTFKLLYGEAFRAPSFFNSFNQNNPVFLGNKNLAPETITTKELITEHSFTENISANLSVFQYNAKDLIQFVFNQELHSSQAKNVGRQKGSGGELLISWKPVNTIHLHFHHSYVDTELDDGSYAPNVPRNKSFVVTNWRATDALNLNLRASHVADRERSQQDARPDIADYTLVSVKASYSLKVAEQTVAVALIADNLLDEDAREPSNGSIPEDYPLAGRRLWAEVTAKF